MTAAAHLAAILLQLVAQVLDGRLQPCQLLGSCTFVAPALTPCRGQAGPPRYLPTQPGQPADALAVAGGVGCAPAAAARSGRSGRQHVARSEHAHGCQQRWPSGSMQDIWTRPAVAGRNAPIQHCIGCRSCGQQNDVWVICGFMVWESTSCGQACLLDRDLSRLELWPGKLSALL